MRPGIDHEQRLLRRLRSPRVEILLKMAGVESQTVFVFDCICLSYFGLLALILRHVKQGVDLLAETERWLSVEEIAHHLGVSKETVYRWLEKQKIPAHRIGKLWKFKPSEVDQWVLSGQASKLEYQGERNG